MSRQIRREIASDDVETCAKGLRRLAQLLGTDSLSNLRPSDWQEKRDELADLQPRIMQLTGSAEEMLRELSADALGGWLGDEALEALLILARDPGERVRASAVGSLEYWPDRESAHDALLEGASAKQWTVRMRAARAMAAHTSAETLDALFECLVDPDSYVRNNAAESLKRRDTATFLPRLRKMQREYPAPQMLDCAIELLGAVGTAEDAEFLAKVGSWLNLSQPSFVRSWARRAAKQIKLRHVAK